MLNHTFTFNGHSSDEFGIKIERFRALNKPARKHDAASVPGRNGNIYKLQDAYEEVPMNYQIFAGGARNAMEFEDARIASFINNSLNKPLTSLIAEIDPIQSGSGEPSPDNVRPITGWDAVNVYRTGKNLLPYPYYHTTRTQNGVTFTDNGDGSITVTGTATATTNFFVVRETQAIKFPTGQTYTLSGCPTGGSSSTYGLIAYAKRADDSNIYTMSEYGNGVSKTFEADIEDEYVATYITIRIYNGQTVNLTFHPMFRLASDSAEWESPVDNETKSISLGSTVYGGTLNVVSGLLTVDRKYVEYDGSSDENWQRYSSTTHLYRIGVSAPGKVGGYGIANWLINTGKTTTGGLANYEFLVGGYLNVQLLDYETVDAWKTYLASNPLQVVYELATPVTYQLTPTEVKTLLGKNNIWANSGNLRDLVVPAVTLEDVFTEIMEWLNSADGYAELTDTYDTTHYREAVFVDATDIENSWNTFGRAIVSFRCRPERFLNSGRYIELPTSSKLGTMTTTGTTPMSINVYESASTSANVVGQISMYEVFEHLGTSGSWYNVRTDSCTGWVQNTYVTLMEGSVVVNPTKHTAKPIITFVLNGNAQKVGINNVIINIPGGGLGTGKIDCENEDVPGMNPYITITPSAVQFPKLKPGRNYVIYDSVTTMDARFWEI